MKKFKMILLMILFAIPAIVKADADAPMLNYKVRINNPEGAYIYEYASSEEGYVKTNDKIEYDKIVKISYEMKIGNQVYGGYVCADEQEKKCGYINLANTSSLDIDLNDYKHDVSLTYRVFDDTCYLYEGPSFNAYKKVSPEKKLEVGYTFTSSYFDDLWIYVPEKNAWVYRGQKRYNDAEPAGMIEVSNEYAGKFLTLKELNIYDNPKTKNKVLATIPANTKIAPTNSYYIEHRKPFYYVTYNGVTGFIEVIRDFDDYSTISVAMELTDTKVTVEKNDIKLYKSYDTNSEVIATIPKGTTFKPSYEFSNFLIPIMFKVEYNNLTGWIKADDVNWRYSPEPENTEEEIEPTEAVEEEIIEPEKIVPDSEPEKISTKGTIILCITVVVLTSLTALVTILLINKKKKNAETNTDNIN